MERNEGGGELGFVEEDVNVRFCCGDRSDEGFLLRPSSYCHSHSSSTNTGGSSEKDDDDRCGSGGFLRSRWNAKVATKFRAFKSNDVAEPAGLR